MQMRNQFHLSKNRAGIMGQFMHLTQSTSIPPQTLWRWSQIASLKNNTLTKTSIFPSVSFFFHLDLSMLPKHCSCSSLLDNTHPAPTMSSAMHRLRPSLSRYYGWVEFAVKEGSLKRRSREDSIAELSFQALESTSKQILHIVRRMHSIMQDLQGKGLQRQDLIHLNVLYIEVSCQIEEGEFSRLRMHSFWPLCLACPTGRLRKDILAEEQL